MKVLQLGKFYPIRGGVEKVMYDLMIGLSEKQLQCDMLCTSIEDYPSGEVRLNEFANLFIVPTTIKVAATTLAPQMISKLRQIAKQYDIIHIHHPDPMAALALYLSNYKGKVVLHWHSDILKQKKLLSFYKPLQSWLINRADKIVGTTPVYVDNSQFLSGVKEKLDYIPIGVDPIQADTKKVDEILLENSGKFLIFSLGRLVEYKGYEYLIKSARFLGDNHRIIIGGKGPLHDSLQDLIKEYNLYDKVKLLGYVSDEEAYAYFKACDVFVLSSIMKTEAFGIVQIEAMSCGKPIITTDIIGSGVGWVNKNNFSGLVVPICDELSIANAINLLSSDRYLYERLAVGSFERYNELFTRDSMVSKCLQLYKNIL